MPLQKRKCSHCSQWTRQYQDHGPYVICGPCNKHVCRHCLGKFEPKFGCNVCRVCLNCMCGGAPYSSKQKMDILRGHILSHKCESCGKIHARGGACGWCGKCRSQCSCRKITRRIALPKKNSLNHKIIKLKRNLGIEVEIARVNQPRLYDERETTYADYLAQSHFKTVHDSSITCGGFEVVFPPASGDRLVDKITRFFQISDLHQFSIDSTCGLHVHADASDFGALEFRRLLLLWYMYEKEFFALCTPERMTSIYCWPYSRSSVVQQFIKQLEGCKHPSMIRNILSKMCYETYNTNMLLPASKSVDAYKQQHYGATGSSDRLQNIRYSALNMHTFFYRGTVELRCKEGTLNKAELTDWVMLFGWFVEIASSLSECEFEEVYNRKKLTLRELMAKYAKYEFQFFKELGA